MYFKVTVLGAIQYLLFISDFPTTNDTLFATFADDRTTHLKSDHLEKPESKIRRALEMGTFWKPKWQIKPSAPTGMDTENLVGLTLEVVWNIPLQIHKKLSGSNHHLEI